MIEKKKYRRQLKLDFWFIFEGLSAEKFGGCGDGQKDK